MSRCAHPVIAKIRDCLPAADDSPCFARDDLTISWLFNPILSDFDPILLDAI